MEELKEYNEAEKILIDDIKNSRIKFADLKERLHILNDLVPSNIDLNPVGLHKVIDENFHDEWNKQKVTYNIDIGSIDDEEIEKVIKKFKKGL